MSQRRTALASLALLAGLAALPAAAQLRPVARPVDMALPALRVEEAVAAAAPVPAPAPAPAPAMLAPAAEDEEETVGPESGLPLPRYVSLKTDEGNARRGPSLDYRVDWVFVREDMPLLLTAEYGHWRRVEDRDGEGGWVHYSVLSGTRTVIVDQPLLPLRARPDERAPETALVEAGVVARIEECGPDWCRIGAGGYSGWAPKAALWGVGAAEILD